MGGIVFEFFLLKHAPNDVKLKLLTLDTFNTVNSKISV